jgi:hypothetical protein
MWTISSLPDPVPLNRLNQGHDFPVGSTTSSFIAHASIALVDFFAEPGHWSVFQKIPEREARVALADFCARRLVEQHDAAQFIQDGLCIVVEPLDKAVTGGNRRLRRTARKTTVVPPPYVLERTDVWCTASALNVMVRFMTHRDGGVEDEKKMDTRGEFSVDSLAEDGIIVPQAVQLILAKIFDGQEKEFLLRAMKHVACVTLQQRLRCKLVDLRAVAFIANGAILPRKSGASELPMAAPPALPFVTPADSVMSKEIQVEVGDLLKYLPDYMQSSSCTENSSCLVTLKGLVVPRGVTLIVGGGYHGKSTLLRAMASGVYDRIPGDGREYCVAVRDAVSVRAEDGRFVNNCNVSAFISNLPTPHGIDKAPDTQHFSTHNASGSTSQAANVAEAIEMGASALLVDEDVSAANFMARDGRMRALVMDESITPLLYRVNGLYDTLGISSIVVVGGVGDWLDVPHHVILLNRYETFDATSKAQSVSRQFSHGHVQYAGRGLVHRLLWEKHGTPIPRRPTDAFASRHGPNDFISVLDGGHAIALHSEQECGSRDGPAPMEDDTLSPNDDDDQGCIDASRMEQLLTRQQLYGCGLCVSWILRAAPKNPTLGIPGLLKLLDETLNQNGMVELFQNMPTGKNGPNPDQSVQQLDHLLESVGFSQRPRLFEVGQALTRLRGIQLEELPVEEEHDDDAVQEREAARRRQELADMWSKRRQK